MGATKKISQQANEKNASCLKRTCTENGIENQRGTAQEHTISEHRVLSCKYFT